MKILILALALFSISAHAESIHVDEVAERLVNVNFSKCGVELLNYTAGSRGNHSILKFYTKKHKEYSIGFSSLGQTHDCKQSNSSEIICYKHANSCTETLFGEKCWSYFMQADIILGSDGLAVSVHAVHKSAREGSSRYRTQQEIACSQ